MISSSASHAAAPTSQAAAAPAPPPPAAAAAALSRRSALVGAASAIALQAVPPLRRAVAASPPPKPYCGVAPSVPTWAYSVPWHESAALAQTTWYRDVNGPPNPLPFSTSGRPFDAKKLPLVVVHGGPGLPSDYLESLELLAGTGRRVIFYDQAGCGRSAGVMASGGVKEGGAVDFYVQELRGLATALALGSGQPFHLLGHGWGGILALEYASRYGGDGQVKGIVAASTPAAYADLVEGRRAAARRALGEQGAAKLEKADEALASASSAAAAAAAAGDLQELKLLASAYDSQVVCRSLAGGGAAFDTAGVKACVAASRAARARPTLIAGSGAGAGRSSAALSRRLNGGRSFAEAGELKGWEAPVLPAGVALLATRGEYDEVEQSSAEALVRRAAGAGATSKSVTFPGAGSYAHLDAWESYTTEVERWLSGVEGSEVKVL
jgi:pimeloyl-ACP methyl ester carboxylesterase